MVLRHNGPVSNKADDEPGTYVIFSLSVISEHEIAAFRGIAGRKRPPRPADNFFYDFGQDSFTDSNWNSRADKLDSLVSAALDRLEATGVDPTELAHDDVFVRAYFTFDPGAETIQPAVIERLARIHAGIWIDANEGYTED